MVCTTLDVSVSTTWSDCVPWPSLLTSSVFPSGESAVVSGRSPSVVCVPAGVTLKPTGVIAVPSDCGPAWVTSRAAAAAPPVTTRARVATAAAARERGRSTRESSCVRAGAENGRPA